MVASAAPVLGQADFREGFEQVGPVSAADGGPQNLVAAGWSFSNQSDPVAGAAWAEGDNFGGHPFEGTGYLQTSSLATDFFGGAVSCWAVLPAIPDQVAGDRVTLWLLGGGSAVADTFFEIRYAASGSDTGTTPTDVGDFTEVLESIELPLSATAYQRVSVELPGPGRIAMRFRAPFLMTFAGRGAYISVDSLTVGTDANAPCGLTLPNPGETVVWDAADGPHSICQDVLIPVGARVEIEPGTELVFDANANLRIEGELVATGTAASPVVLSGASDFESGISAALGGQVAIRHAEVGVPLRLVGQDAAMEVVDSLFTAEGRISGQGNLIAIERCVFDGVSAGSGSGSSLGGSSDVVGSVKLVDSQFRSGANIRVTGLMHLDNVSVEDVGLRLVGEIASHPVLVENVSVTGNSSGAGITIEGPQFLISDGVVTQGNRYPLAMSGAGAGLLPGTTLPQIGNSENVISVPTFVLAARRYWANTGLPYVVQGEFPQNFGGGLEVEPGTNIKFGPNAGAFIVGSSELKLRGTRDEPIVLESLVPSQPWFGLKWVDDFDARARHTIFDGGQISIQSDGGILDLIHCTVRNSQEGTASVTGGIVRLFGSEIVDNAVGMTTTTSGRVEADGGVTPSVFDGNGIAVEYNNTNGVTPYLRFNWWGDESGPDSTILPGGTGDPVVGVHPAGYTPFLTSPPSLDDEHPIVEMEPTYFLANTGDKIILRWTASDDDEIVGQRIEFADVDFPDDYRVVATLPPDVTTYEFSVPEVLPTNRYTTPSGIRIVAVDSTGQESWDKSILRVPYQADFTPIYQEVSDPGLGNPRETIDICWSPGGNASVYVLLDDYVLSDANGGSNTGCLPTGARLPASSTDLARNLVLTSFGAGGRVTYSFSDYYEIRPDPRFGDAPPAVSLTSPVAGETYAGGSVIPIAWEASDDVGLRSFGIQASYDGGRAWHWVTRDLPADARSFAWDLPESSGIDDVRVRVMAIDHRFQTSSATAGPFAIAAGSGCPADFAPPAGVLNIDDVIAYLDAFALGDTSADLTGDDALDIDDVLQFVDSFAAGCP